MKKSSLILSLSLLLGASSFAQNSYADIDTLGARFSGGCKSENTEGSCTIKATASGTDLSSETARLYYAANATDPLKRFSRRIRAFDEMGHVKFKFKNVVGGCFQVRTGPNGSDKPDYKSKVLCEK